MKILVDTSIWSLALRRSSTATLSPSQSAQVAELADLVRDGRAVMIGAIRQELLSGIKLQAQFEQLRSALQAFDDCPVTVADYELAAEFFNRCRAVGVQGSNTDFLICAVACRNQLAIATVDGDFVQFAKCLPIRLLAAP